MPTFAHYFGRFDNLRGAWQGGVSGLPGWARLIVLIFALPGLALLALSIAGILVSLLALLLLAAPVYSFLKRLTGMRMPPTAEQTGEGPVVFDFPSSGTKRVEATVVDDRGG